ncbi:hypothetical protein GGF43_002977 [Coemansia sp. RSA 2618]|nr:hypothetical protein GGF43_002977 [Coemansia sp. RSA 2618]
MSIPEEDPHEHTRLSIPEKPPPLLRNHRRPSMGVAHEYRRQSQSMPDKPREYTRASLSLHEKPREYTRPSLSTHDYTRPSLSTHDYTRPSLSTHEKQMYGYAQMSIAVPENARDYAPYQAADPRVSDWSLGSVYKARRPFRRIHLPCPVEYYNRLAACMSLERLPLPSSVQCRRSRRGEGTPRQPSIKTAIISAIDLLVHISWIANTTSAFKSCSFPLFFFSTMMLTYMFFLGAFTSMSLLRLRHIQQSQPHGHGAAKSRVDAWVVAGVVVAACVISLLPVVMGQAAYDEQLHVCWFAGGPIAARWVWMSLNSWIVLALLLLVTASACIGVLLINERRSLLRSLVQQQPSTKPEPLVTTTLDPARASSSSSSSIGRTERWWYGGDSPEPETAPLFVHTLPASARSAGPRMPIPQHALTSRPNKHMSLPIGALPTHRPLALGSTVGSWPPTLHASRPPTLSKPPTLHPSRPPTLAKPPTLHPSRPPTLAKPPTLHPSRPPTLSKPPTLHPSRPPPPPLPLLCTNPTTRPLHTNSERSVGQLHRIEQRIHVLISTGALRVAMRALVPLLTQLPLVIWSTIHTQTGGAYTVYVCAILLLSTQGLLDMMLYYIFDTQNDAPSVSIEGHGREMEGGECCR